MAYGLGAAKGLRTGLILALLALLAACASRPPESDPAALAQYREANDPLEPTNRAVYKFNQGFYTVILDPLAEGYRTVLPDPLQDMIRNFLRNLGSPIRLINNILQGDAEQAGVTVARFMTNSTIGFAGVFDPAQDAGLEYRQEDFGQTLAIWGAGEGAYLVLPVFGPSSVRDSVGFLGDILMDPVTWLLREEDLSYLNWTRTGMEGLDAYIQVMDEYKNIQRTALDPYAQIRSLRRQMRRDLIYNGDPPSDTDDGGDDQEFEEFPDFE